MKEALPPPSFLPVTVTMLIPSKSLVFKGIRVKPTDSANDLKPILEKKLNDTGNAFVALPAKNTFTLRRFFLLHHLLLHFSSL